MEANRSTHDRGDGNRVYDSINIPEYQFPTEEKYKDFKYNFELHTPEQAVTEFGSVVLGSLNVLSDRPGNLSIMTEVYRKGGVDYIRPITYGHGVYGSVVGVCRGSSESGPMNAKKCDRVIKIVSIKDLSKFKSEVYYSRIASNSKLGPRMYDFFKIGTYGFIVYEYLHHDVISHLLTVPDSAMKNDEYRIYSMVASFWYLTSGHIQSDLHSDNVMVTSDGEYRLIDFGLVSRDEYYTPVYPFLYLSGSIIRRIGDTLNVSDESIIYLASTVYNNLLDTFSEHMTSQGLHTQPRAVRAYIFSMVVDTIFRITGNEQQTNFMDPVSIHNLLEYYIFEYELVRLRTIEVIKSVLSRCKFE